MGPSGKRGGRAPAPRGIAEPGASRFRAFVATRASCRNARAVMAMLDCVIVGAGIHGLCTAFWLHQRGLQRLLVLDQHAPGHAYGSSHGASRITRSSYDDPALVALAKEAHEQGWPALERAVGQPLRLPTPGVFFGPADGPIAGYCRATAAAGAAVERLPLAAARQRFPLLRFDDGDSVLLDHTAAVVLAAATMQALRNWLAEHGVALSWNTRVTAIRPHAHGVVVDATTTTLASRHVVLACGAWTGQLHADDLPTLVVQRQSVGYFDVDAPTAACAPGTFPVWARIGRTAEDFTYGLPSLHGSGLKAALHRTTGPGTRPDVTPPPIDEQALLALARDRFACPVRGLTGTEHCLYTMAPEHRLHVVRARDLPLTTIAACSGHAFKFGPVIGRAAADQVGNP